MDDRELGDAAAAYTRRRVAAVVAVLLAFVALMQVLGDGKTPLAGRRAAIERALRELRPPEPQTAGPGIRAGGPLPSRREQLAAVARLLRMRAPLFCAGGRGRWVALTFDDGPGPRTAATVRLLQANGARATFFLVGRNLVRYPNLPRAELRVGALGNHTVNHAFLTRVDRVVREFEIAHAKRVIQEVTRASVVLFRPPYEARSRAVDRVVRRHQMLQVLWNVDPRDSEGATTRQVVRDVKEHVGPGAIVVLHENKPVTLPALRKLLPWLRRQGLQPVSVPELLALDPPRKAQVRAGFKGCSR